MLRLASTSIVVLAMLAAAAPCRADWDSYWAGVHRDQHRNNCWPLPFSPIDMQAARAPFGPMIARGWERQNLLGDHHFESDSRTLTQSGVLKVRWILTQTPLSRRTVFIERGLTADASAARVEAVKAAVTGIVPPGDGTQIVVSEMSTQGWTASDVDSASRRFADSAPAPRLPASQTSGGGEE